MVAREAEPPDPAPVERILHELYAAHQFFRNLGFPSDNLFVSQDIDGSGGPYSGQICISCRLHWQKKEFIYTIAPVEDYASFVSAWRAFIAVANAGKLPEAWLRKNYEQSFIFQSKVLVVTALHAKGIIPPRKLQ